jgi:xylose isomerase
VWILIFHSTLVNFWSNAEAKAALDEAGLVAGAVCLRYEAIQFARGAMNHPDADHRREAIELTKEAAQTAIDIGCDEVVVWSAFDGYDYPFQVDYNAKWQELIDAFRECCDAYPNVKFSLEYKPTDENTRFFTVPSTGAALLMAQEVNRVNFGLTLDVGHMLMSGENPGQSIAMVGRAGKLFGIQLNDGYTRLAAEDGLMFGSVHPRMAVEIMYQLQKANFTGHVYFDTFPQRSDPIKEAEYNIRRVKTFWKAAQHLLHDSKGTVSSSTLNGDAIAALELVDESLVLAHLEEKV